MSNRAPNITIPVDLTNPGQFFACCGLLELANRLWPGAEGSRPEVMGKFDNSAFYIHCSSASLSAMDLFKKIVSAPLIAFERCGSVELELGMPQPLRIDWWRNCVQCDADHLRTWSGRQVSLIGDTAKAIKAFSRLPRTDENILDIERVARKPDGKKVAPLGFDAGRVGTAQDLGSSADNLGQPIACCVWTEFLALVALQRFGLLPLDDETFEFHAWREPLTPDIASIAARGMLPQVTGAIGRFRLAPRSGKGYYAFQLISLSEWRPQ